MSLKDLKNFDYKTFDWVAFGNKLLTPKPRKKIERKVGDVWYASFTTRVFAMSIDLLLLVFLFSGLFQWLSQLVFPEFNNEKVFAQMTSAANAVAQQQMTLTEFWEMLVSSGLGAKILFDQLLQVTVTGIVVVWVWVKYATTPGMKLFCVYIADADTGAKPTLKQSIIRYIGVILAMIPLSLGMLTMFFSKRKQAPQDMLANTVVLQKHSAWPWQKKNAAE